MGRLPTECERAHLWASLATDAEITELERASLGAHLRGCHRCADYARQLEEIARLVRETPRAEPGRPLLPEGRLRRGYRRFQLAASAAAVVAALALGSLAGVLNSRDGGESRTQEAASHRLLIQQSLLAFTAVSPKPSAKGGRLIAS